MLSAVVFPRATPGSPPPDFTPAFADIVDRISKAPGVVHAAAISGGMPLGGSMSITDMAVPGRSIEGDKGVSIRGVYSDYHRALQIPLKRGRLFDANDRKGSPNVAVLNETAARKYFPNEDPLRRTVVMDRTERTIVGIVGDVRQSSLESEPMEEAYVPMAQRPRPTAELVVRTSGDPSSVLPHVKSAVMAALPDVPVRNARTMEELLNARIAQRRLNMLLLGLFGVLGLVISAVGIYGVLAYAVSQRTREIGIRMALGATRGRVMGMVLRQAAVLVVLGLVMGGTGAWYLSTTASKFLFRLDAHDPRAFAVAVAVLIGSALIASVVPARRAASADPIVALRAE